MKRVIYTGVLLSTLLLSACGESSSSYKELEKEVTEYNTMASSTIESYKTTKSFAERKYSEIADYIFSNKETPLVDESGTKLEPLSAEDTKLFENRSIIYNDFYTAIGSSAVRQVLVIKGKDSKLMTVKIIWSDKGIVEMRRDVRDL